jgi:maltose O-acetyltransferase
MKRALVRWIKKLLYTGSHSNIEELKKKGLKVGRNFHIQQGCIIDESHAYHIEIGDNVSLAPNVHILAHDASTWWFLEHSRIKNVKIGNRVFIGAGSIIMPGVTIGNDVIVGAGSVVTKSIPDDSVYAGNPAMFITNTSTYITREREQMTAENTFGEEFSERNNASIENKELIKQMAAKHGTAFLK